MTPAATRVLRDGFLSYSAWALVPGDEPGYDGPWFLVSRHWTRSGARHALRAFVRSVTT